MDYVDEVDRMDVAKRTQNAFPLQFITPHSSFIISSASRKILRWILLFFTLCAWGDELTHTIQEIDPRGYYLTFEDGSAWQISWWNAWSSWHWKRGEHVQILDEQEEEKILFNLDQPERKARVSAQLCPSLENMNHRHFVREILDNGSLIKLENGFLFRLAWPESAEIQAEMQRWSVGDELLLDAWTESNGGPAIFMGYLLKNISKYSEVLMRFDEKQEKYSAHKVEEVGWNSITLDDGSRWEYSRLDVLRTWGWSKGDPVMIFFKNRQDLSDYILINCHAAPRQGRFVHVQELTPDG